jgi:predicted TIM-barrel fold metal-dependent hydrolase
MFPEATFIVPHFGAGMFRETMMLADLCPNVYVDTSSSNRWMGYMPTPTTLATVFRQALGVVGHERLLFGTDSSFFPRGWHASIFDMQVAALAEAGATAEQARAIFGGNLRRLLTATTGS